LRCKLSVIFKKRGGALEIPKRSPCLNVCDYFLWSEVNRRMREQEKKFSSAKRETRKGFLPRLRRAALNLPPDVVSSSVNDMRRRCARLLAADSCNVGGGRSVLGRPRSHSQLSEQRRKLMAPQAGETD